MVLLSARTLFPSRCVTQTRVRTCKLLLAPGPQAPKRCDRVMWYLSPRKEGRNLYLSLSVCFVLRLHPCQLCLHIPVTSCESLKGKGGGFTQDGTLLMDHFQGNRCFAQDVSLNWLSLSSDYCVPNLYYLTVLSEGASRPTHVHQVSRGEIDTAAAAVLPIVAPRVQVESCS